MSDILTPYDAVNLGMFLGMVERNSKVRYLLDDCEREGTLRGINPPQGSSWGIDVRDYEVRVTSSIGAEMFHTVREMFPLIGKGCLSED